MSTLAVTVGRGAVALPRFEQEPAAAYVYRILKRSLVMGETSSDVMTEAAVAKCLDVSRTPVRAAFVRLATEQLMEILPGLGARPAPITLRQVQELSQVRLHLEQYAATGIVDRKLNAQPISLLIREFETLTQQDDVDVYEVLQLDFRFHFQLVALLGNTEITRLYESLRDRQLRIGFSLFKAQPDRLAFSAPHHQRILDAILDRDEARAKREIAEHLALNPDQLSSLFVG